MEYKYTCSLGSHCQSSQLLKNNKLKKHSYPFDWIFSSCYDILHCLRTDFKIFLDKSYYVSLADKRCSHLYYHGELFNHHNPLTSESDYNYYCRCVARFRQLLQFEERKFFIMILVNMDSVMEHDKNKIIDFNNTFSTYAKNYTLVVVYHIKNKPAQHHEFTHNGNIDFLELHTLSASKGVEFTNSSDNEYLNNIINTAYKFSIEN